MAAGLGFKDFVTGEVLTAADVDGYLMQGVWVFASAAARDAAVTSPQEGNFAYLKDTNVTTYYTGSAWANLDTTGMTNPMTTTGDTIYSSSGSTPARLGIGSTGQVLTVASGVPSWATASSGAMTKITSATFSTTATLTIDSVFTSTYYNYVVKIWAYSDTASTVDLLCRLRKSDSTTFTSGYSAGAQKITRSGTITQIASDNSGSFLLSTDIGAGINNRTSVSINVNIIGTGERPEFDWFGASNGDTPGLSVLGGGWVDGNNIFGIQFFGSSGNISGTYAIYGLEK